MKFDEIIPSKKSRIVIIAVSVLLACVATFAVGFYAGAEKARFSGNWHEGYMKVMAGPRPGTRGQIFVDRQYVNPHGSSGSIIKIENSEVIIKDQEGVEKNIIIGDMTAIRRGFSEIKLSDLKVGDIVVVIGSPTSEGRVEAKLVRVMP